METELSTLGKLDKDKQEKKVEVTRVQLNGCMCACMSIVFNPLPPSVDLGVGEAAVKDWENCINPE